MSDEMTPDRLVAANLRRAREEKGWSQGKAGKELGAHLGEEWSKARWSSAERTDPDIVRGFTANELVAFSAIFGRPVDWFLMPPAEESDHPLPDQVAGLPLNEYLDLVYAPDLEGMAARIVALADQLGWNLRERMRARMTPIWTRAMSDIAGGLISLYGDMTVIARKLEASSAELREAAFGVVESDQPDLTDTEQQHVEAGRRLDAIDEAAESENLQQDDEGRDEEQ